MITAIKDILIKSGLTISNRKAALFFLKNRSLMKILRFKIDPAILLDSSPDRRQFSMLVSEISTGPVFKTTGFERHNASDDVLVDYIKKFPGKPVLADIGVSDGTSALYLLQKLQINQINAQVSLYDKYTRLNLLLKWPLRVYTNVDNEIVYIKFFCFLFFVYPFKIVFKETTGTIISFDNPILKKFRLKIDYFDIFNTKLRESAYFIKCANILNPVYFSRTDIKLALKNIHANLKEGGYVFIIHNTNDIESLLILKKDGNALVIDKQTGDDGLLEYLGVHNKTITISH